MATEDAYQQFVIDLFTSSSVLKVLKGSLKGDLIVLVKNSSRLILFTLKYFSLIDWTFSVWRFEYVEIGC